MALCGVESIIACTIPDALRYYLLQQENLQHLSIVPTLDTAVCDTDANGARFEPHFLNDFTLKLE